MNKIDPAFTRQIQQWLDTPAADRDIAAGAMLLLQLNRNRAFYNTVIQRPGKFAAKLEYELKKHLRIRLAGMTLIEVARLDAEVTPSVQEIVDNPPVLTPDDELPKGTIAIGRRADHDSLPAEIRRLWDDNFENYKVIRQLFEELKGMADLQPCDRFDKLQLLKSYDTRYRENLGRYDSYVPSADGAEPSDADVSDAADEPAPLTPADAAKVISSARKTLSKYRTAYAEAESDEAKAKAVSKMQACVSQLVSLGSDFKQSTVDELTAIGISFAKTDQ